MKASYYKLPISLRISRFISKYVYFFVLGVLIYAIAFAVLGKVRFDIPLHNHLPDLLGAVLFGFALYIPISLLIKRKVISRDLANYIFICEVVFMLIPVIRDLVNYINSGAYEYGISLCGIYVSTFFLFKYNDKHDDRLINMPEMYSNNSDNSQT